MSKKTRQVKQEQREIARWGRLYIEGTFYGDDLWRAWLIGPGVAEEACGDKTLAEVVKDPAAWARRAMARRVNGIDKHVAKLRAQVADLGDERRQIANYLLSTMKGK